MFWACSGIRDRSRCLRWFAPTKQTIPSASLGWRCTTSSVSPTSESQSWASSRSYCFRSLFPRAGPLFPLNGCRSWPITSSTWTLTPLHCTLPGPWSPSTWKCAPSSETWSFLQPPLFSSSLQWFTVQSRPCDWDFQLLFCDSDIAQALSSALE